MTIPIPKKPYLDPLYGLYLPLIGQKIKMMIVKPDEKFDYQFEMKFDGK